MKSIKITPPEGFEIDRENSTFEEIVFKPIELTCEKICQELFKEKEIFYISTNGEICKSKFLIKYYTNSAGTSMQLEQLLALNQLRNISIYYNRKHLNTNDHYYTIVYSRINDSYCVFPTDMHYKSSTDVIFNQKEDAKEVINNPNFRTILDTVYK